MRKTARFLVQKGLALRRKATKGFTLVELLIVIALIGILAVAVLAAINPLEQLNRARDTGMESDSSQLLAAIDRYYAANEHFPWVAVGEVTSDDDAYGYVTAKTPGVGVCSDTACSDDGVLIGSLELKSEFRNRKFITTAIETEMIYVGKAEEASSSVYACWVPKSNAKRAKATVSFSAATGGGYNKDTAVCDPAGSGIDWTAVASACLFCIPH